MKPGCSSTGAAGAPVVWSKRVVESGQKERDKEEVGRRTRCCWNAAPGLEAGSMNRSGNQEVDCSRAVEIGFYRLRTVWSLVQETGL